MPTRSQKVLKFFNNKFNLVDLELLKKQTKCVVKMMQSKSSMRNWKLLKMKKKKEERNVKISSKISGLNPYLDENWIIRGGGRLEKFDISNDSKSSILMPKDCHISKLIIPWYHQKTANSGMALNEVWCSSFWIVYAKSVARSLIYNCVTCKSLRGKIGKQPVPELLSDILQESRTFTYCGVYLFGPFTIKNYRKE